MRNKTYDVDQSREYRNSRDIAALYTAHFSAVGMAEIANHVFSLALEEDIESLGARQASIRREAFQKRGA